MPGGNGRHITGNVDFSVSSQATVCAARATALGTRETEQPHTSATSRPARFRLSTNAASGLSGRDGLENELLQHLSDVVERREANSYITATLSFRMLEAALHVRHRPGRGRLISRPEVHADAGAWHARCRLAMSLPAPSGRRREARAPGADRDRRRGGRRP
jgi:hypothetical protein